MYVCAYMFNIMCWRLFPQQQTLPSGAWSLELKHPTQGTNGSDVPRFEAIPALRLQLDGAWECWAAGLLSGSCTYYKYIYIHNYNNRNIYIYVYIYICVFQFHSEQTAQGWALQGHSTAWGLLSLQTSSVLQHVHGDSKSTGRTKLAGKVQGLA